MLELAILYGKKNYILIIDESLSLQADICESLEKFVKNNLTFSYIVWTRLNMVLTLQHISNECTMYNKLGENWKSLPKNDQGQNHGHEMFL